MKRLILHKYLQTCSRRFIKGSFPVFKEFSELVSGPSVRHSAAQGRFSVSLLSFTFLSIVLLIACNSDTEKQETVTEPVIEDSKELNKAQQVFYMLPSPFELASLLKSSGATYNKGILNTKENLSKYTTAQSKAINLGVYGADLSYSSIFKQTQAATEFIVCVRQLTEELGISSAFDASQMKRLESMKGNDDSLQQIVAEAYMIANIYLKDNERSKIASLILVGGWVEGLYIATSLANTGSKNQDLKSMIAEQQLSLDNLVSLLESYEDRQDIDNLLKDLTELKTIYEKTGEVETAQATASVNVEVKTDGNKNITVIGDSEAMTLTDEQLAAITAKVDAIRKSYVQM